MNNLKLFFLFSISILIINSCTNPVELPPNDTDGDVLVNFNLDLTGVEIAVDFSLPHDRIVFYLDVYAEFQGSETFRREVFEKFDYYDLLDVTYHYIGQIGGKIKYDSGDYIFTYKIYNVEEGTYTLVIKPTIYYSNNCVFLSTDNGINAIEYLSTELPYIFPIPVPVIGDQQTHIQTINLSFAKIE